MIVVVLVRSKVLGTNAQFVLTMIFVLLVKQGKKHTKSTTCSKLDTLAQLSIEFFASMVVRVSKLISRSKPQATLKLTFKHPRLIVEKSIQATTCGEVLAVASS